MSGTTRWEAKAAKAAANAKRAPDLAAEAAVAAAAQLRQDRLRAAQAANGDQQRQPGLSDVEDPDKSEPLGPSGQRRVSIHTQVLRRAAVHGGVVAVLVALGDADLESPGCWVNTSEIAEALGVPTDDVHGWAQRACAEGQVAWARDPDVKCRHIWQLNVSAADVSRGAKPADMSAAEWAACEHRGWGAVTLDFARLLARAGRGARAALKVAVAISARMGRYDAGDKPPSLEVVRAEIGAICDVGVRTVTRAYNILRALKVLSARVLPPRRHQHWRGLRLQLAAGVRQGVLVLFEGATTPQRC